MKILSTIFEFSFRFRLFRYEYKFSTFLLKNRLPCEKLEIGTQVTWDTNSYKKNKGMLCEIVDNTNYPKTYIIRGSHSKKIWPMPIPCNEINKL